MGWFSGSPPSPSGESGSPATPSSKDPIASLEPSLREYLQAQYTKSRTTTSTSPASGGGEPTPPPAHPSSYGSRYAHLWTTYQPPQAGASEQEALTGILRAHRARQAHAARAALENCSEAQLALRACHRAGGLRGCATHARRLDDCYSTQLRLLRVLGYMAEPGRDARVEESIQMHADRLYREKVGEEAIGRTKLGGVEIVVEPPGKEEAGGEKR
ncbi:hypothetical protein EV426DRAFT_34694 [Tirmania nivea]|nr:hypothetical protein EV426DRAFT_34694 [Tirmania nivea]